MKVYLHFNGYSSSSSPTSSSSSTLDTFRGLIRTREGWMEGWNKVSHVYIVDVLILCPLGD